MKMCRVLTKLFSLEAVSQEDLNRMQVQANDAVVAETAFTPCIRLWKDRPDYVSSLEWSVLKTACVLARTPRTGLSTWFWRFGSTNRSIGGSIILSHRSPVNVAQFYS